MAAPTSRWRIEGLPDPPAASVVGTPDRRPGSLRRTAHLHATFPGGYGSAPRITGRARDLLTPRDGAPTVLHEDALDIELDDARVITAITTDPHRDGVDQLVGVSVARGLRAAVDAALPGDEASPLVFLLDDVQAASMIGGTAWSQHRPMELPHGPARSFLPKGRDGGAVCSGLRPGGYYEQSVERGITFPHWVQPAGDLDVADPWAWHEIDPAAEVCFRRRRRIDAWREGDAIEIDAHFRDSLWDTEHAELALHEYTVAAEIDGESGILLRLDVVGRVLPFPECAAASPHAAGVVGTDVASLRTRVQTVLSGVECCTHLNDLLRGLSAVHRLARSIEA